MTDSHMSLCSSANVGTDPPSCNTFLPTLFHATHAKRKPSREKGRPSRYCVNRSAPARRERQLERARRLQIRGRPQEIRIANADRAEIVVTDIRIRPVEYVEHVEPDAQID